MLGAVLLLCILVIFFLLKRRKEKESAKNSNEPSEFETKEQRNAALGEMPSAAEYDDGVSRDLLTHSEETDFSGRLQYPNEVSNVGGRLQPET